MCASVARWVGYDADSTHARPHQIYWPKTRHVSVERSIRFTADTINVDLPPTRPLHQSTTTAQPPAPTITTPQTTSQPPPATDNGEEEVEVEDELHVQVPTPTASTTCKEASAVKPPGTPVVQPTCQSARLRKPSALVRSIEAGEGTTDGHLSAHVNITSLISSSADIEPEWAYLASINDYVTVTIQEAEGDLKPSPAHCTHARLIILSYTIYYCAYQVTDS